MEAGWHYFLKGLLSMAGGDRLDLLELSDPGVFEQLKCSTRLPISHEDEVIVWIASVLLEAYFRFATVNQLSCSCQVTHHEHERLHYLQ